MTSDAFDDQVKGIASLENPLSRSIYRLVSDQDWRSRDQVAEALELPRSVAAFHLEKLVGSGLLKVRYQRLTGKSGPGAGRPTKFYGRSDREFDISLPPRHYDLAGSLLADAITRANSDGMTISEAVAQVAHESGQLVGVQSSREHKGSARDVVLIEVLAQNGYEPKLQGRQITMRNCPFDSLAEQYRDLICRMNFEFIAGVVEGIGESERYTPHLAPEVGYCCVRLDAR